MDTHAACANQPAAQDFSAGAAFVDGRYCPVTEARIPLLDWGFIRSDACQDTVSVWKGSFFRLEEHLIRFERSYERLRMVSPLARDEIREVLFRLIELTGFQDAYVQMIMTRGRPPIGSRDPRQCVNRFQAYAIPYVWIATPEVQARGLHLHLSSRCRVPPQSVDPEVKHYHWLDFEMGLFDAYDRGAETVCLVDLEGNVAEGPGFNIFAVEAGGITTPKHYVLDGMTRTSVGEVCQELGIPLQLGTVPPARLTAADEVFISTTAGGIIPISVINGQPVGTGRPGPISLRIRERYWSKRTSGWHATPARYGA
ncbi:MAG TPA: aminotransferase class IV [Azospirillaceae bacterium]|nr:aminotransferase class IV [Azospirillaceae bacterium]